MIRLTTALVLILAALLVACGDKGKPVPAPVANPGEAPYYTSLDSAKAAAGEGQYIVVKFYFDTCPWCKTLDTVVLVDSQVIDFFTKDMLLVKANRDVDSSLVRQYKVSAYPTLVMMDKTGKEVDRLVGYCPPDEFLKTFRDYTKGIGTLNDLLARAQTGSDRTLFMTIADKYKYSGGEDDALTWYNKVVQGGDSRDSLSGEARMSLADMFDRAKEFDKAIAAYTSIADDFKTGQLGEAADGSILDLYCEKGDTAKAIVACEQWLQKYPAADSRNIEWVKKTLNDLKNPAPAAQ
jgi:thioredoxin-related protein